MNIMDKLNNLLPLRSDIIKIILEKNFSIHDIIISKCIDGDLNSMIYYCKKGKIEINTFAVGLYKNSSITRNCFHYAIRYNHIHILKYICENIKDLLSNQIFYLDELKYAVELGHLDVVKYLCERTNSSTGEVLMSKFDYRRLYILAKINDRQNIADYLLSVVGEISYHRSGCDNDYITEQIAINNNFRAIEFFRMIGTPPKVFNLAAIRAARLGNLEMVKYLYNYEDIWNIDKGCGALCDAAICGQFEVIKYLHKLGVDLTCRNNFVSRYSLNKDIRKYIRDNGGFKVKAPTYTFKKLYGYVEHEKYYENIECTELIDTL
jgi:ankyrin repeat protein